MILEKRDNKMLLCDDGQPGGTAMFGAQEDIISPQFTKENSRFVRSYGTEEENGKNRKSATRFDQFKQKGLARFRRFMFLDLKVGAGLEKATVCFILQSFLYGAVLQVRPDNNRDDLAGESDRHVNYRHVTSVTILTFTFIYALKKGLQGLPNNCLFLFWAGSLKEKFLLLQNLWINFVLPIFLPYLTALFLRDAKSLGDVILNSVAIYFMIELDDEMVFQEDLNVLQDDLVFTYLDIMRTAATRRGQAARPRLDLERFLIRLATVASFVCLALAIFCYFRGSPLEWFVDQVNKDGDTPQPASQATEEGGVDGAPYPPPRHHFL